jgi:hypothetical protein
MRLRRADGVKHSGAAAVTSSLTIDRRQQAAPPHPGYHSAMPTPSVTFAGLPHATFAKPGQIAVLGIDHATPYEKGKPSHSAGAPAALRAALTG